MSESSLINAVKFYINKIVKDPSCNGMKALILDPVTTKIVSLIYSQTQILEQEVYLVEQLGKHHEPMTHLKAAVFIQPTEANLSLLLRELKDPKFSEYHIYFSNRVSPHIITRLGRGDENEVIRQVQEYYADYQVINDNFFHLGIDNSLMLASAAERNPASASIMERNINGIISLLLSLKIKPTQIRYTKSSQTCQKISNDIVSILEKEIELFEFSKKGVNNTNTNTNIDSGGSQPVLLILDRMDDPVTPLLTQWTYQAMVHELLGINNNRVILKNTPSAKNNKDLNEIVLSCTQDEFFNKHCYDNRKPYMVFYCKINVYGERVKRAMT